MVRSFIVRFAPIPSVICELSHSGAEVGRSTFV